MSASQRLVHLLELADKGPALRAALAEELAELLTDWPEDCPLEMRRPCEALLAQAAREVDRDTRARLRVRLYADPELTARVLPREQRVAAEAAPPASPVPPHEAHRSLMQMVRGGSDISLALAQTAGLDPAMVAHILADESGHALAIACKGAGVDRAAYSAIVMLTCHAGDLNAVHAKLDEFDAVPGAEAAMQLRGWRETECHAAE